MPVLTNIPCKFKPARDHLEITSVDGDINMDVRENGEVTTIGLTKESAAEVIATLSSHYNLSTNCIDI